MSGLIGKIEKLKESIVAKNTSVLVAAQVFSRLIQVFYVAALARYVGTEGVGKISTATALDGICILLVAPGMTTLLVRDVAANRQLGTTYLGNMLFIRVLMSAPFILLTIVIGTVAGYPRDTMYIVFVYALVYVVDAFGQVFSSAFQAFEVMEYDAVAQASRDLVNVFLSLLCIFLGLPLLVIVGISLVAQVGKFMLMAQLTNRRLFHIRLAVQIDACKDLLVRSLPFGALTILFSVRFQLGIFILSLFDTASAVGIYAAATTFILILLMLAGAFSTSVFPAYSRMYRNGKGNLPLFYQLSYKYLMLIGFALAVGTLLFGGKIIELIYGARFSDAGGPILILSGSLFALMGYSNGPLLNAIGRQRFFAWTQALLVVADGLLCVILIPHWGLMGAAVANTAACIGGLILHSIACHHWLGLSLPWAVTMKTLLAVLVAGAAMLIATSVGVSWWVVFLVLGPFAFLLPILTLKLVNTDELRFLARGMPVANNGV